MQRKLSKFEQISIVYRKKYKMSLDDFLSFLKEKVEISQSEIKHVEYNIKRRGLKIDYFDERQLNFMLRIVAAVQYCGNVDKLNDETMLKYENINLRKSDKNEIKTGNIVEQPVVVNITKVDKQLYLYKQVAYGVKIYGKVEAKSSQHWQTPPKTALLTQSKQETPVRDPSMRFLQPTMQKVKILYYYKTGNDYINPVIKFKISYNEKHNVFRRFSEFEKLLAYLAKKYYGYLLPELPPKEGLVRNLSCFLGVNYAFLNYRQQRLYYALNTLLYSKFIKNDYILSKFLTYYGFEVPTVEYMSSLYYLKSLKDIALNAKDIKDYSVAYYNYLSEYKQNEVKTEITEKYNSLKGLIEIYTTLNEYREAINVNFDKRRNLMKKVGLDFKCLVVTELDKFLATTALEIRNMGNYFQKYLNLNSEYSWLNHLIKQKQAYGSSLGELYRSRKTIEGRIEHMSHNLMYYLEEFDIRKSYAKERIVAMIVDWRKKIHP